MNNEMEPIKQTIRLNRKLGRVTINGKEVGRWTGHNRYMAEEHVQELLSEQTDTFGRPVDRVCPDCAPYTN